MLEKLKVAAYLEDAGEDPASACKTMLEAGINHAVIRHVWTSNIKDLSDSGCAKLRKIMSDTNITPAAIISTVGDVIATDLPKVSTEAVDRTFNLARYFGASIVGLTCGLQVSARIDRQIDEWLYMIAEKATSHNITTVVETASKSHIIAPADWAALLVKHRRIKLLYDPAQLIIRQNIDPFIKYWTLLKQHIVAIDVRDYKIGKGFKPIGFGDTHIARTILDAIQSKYGGWFFFEPSLGRKHGTAVTKSEVFKLAFSAFRNVLDQS